ncbi:MAG: hypothetical protein ACXV2C_08180 [Candidatus Bathyarchaeia archaeon]
MSCIIIGETLNWILLAVWANTSRDWVALELGYLLSCYAKIQNEFMWMLYQSKIFLVVNLYIEVVCSEDIQPFGVSADTAK